MYKDWRLDMCVYKYWLIKAVGTKLYGFVHYKLRFNANYLIGVISLLLNPAPADG